MALSAQERGAIIADLTANCENWKSPGDDQILSQMSDEKLTSLKVAAAREAQAVAVANAAVKGFLSPDGNAYRVNPENGRWEERPMTANEKKAIAEKKKKSASADPDEEEETATVNKVVVDPAPVKKPRTLDEFIKSAPPALRDQVENTLRNAQQIEQREKDKVITELIANVSEADRQSQREWLNKRPLDELQNMLNLIPKAPTEDVAVTTNRRPRRKATANPEEQDMLGLPTMNWKAMDDNETGRKNSPSTVNNEEDDVDEDEWLKTAPPRIRTAVQNAIVVESRERDKLISELTANVTDEESERQLIEVLKRKPLAELKALSSISAGRSSERKPLYFGAPGGGAAPVGNRGGDSSDDVLPLPRMDWKDSKQA